MNQSDGSIKDSSAQQKILVIDDDESYREIITLALSMADYNVIEAKNGLDGLAAAKMYYPDLILCDINMPKMNGHELLRTLKEEPDFAGIPFIFFTGNAAPGDLRKGMQMGADDYLTKPFSAEELLTAVETRLTKKKKMQKYFESQFDDIKANIISHLPHEFRTPLNGILGFSQILADQNDLSEDEVKEIGVMILRSGKRLQHLLENMVLFGQLQLWMNDLHKIEEMRQKSTTLLEVSHAVIGKLLLRYKRADAISNTLNESSVQISSIYLTKILEEVIDNALKFSTAGAAITISNEKKGSSVNIIVRDEGRGMSEEQIQKISGFQQFERGYYEQQGAGLGLAIAKIVTEIHGGSLSIESAENKGTTVTIAIPNAKRN